MSNNDKSIACKNCGTEVIWHTSAKTGKRYLAEIKRWHGDYTLNEMSFFPAHKCTPDIKYMQERKAADQQKEANIAHLMEWGMLAKGQHVTVVKGRKIPKGTQGIITWIANQIQYDTVRIGIKDSNDQMHYTSIKNVEATGKNTIACDTCCGLGKYQQFNDYPQPCPTCEGTGTIKKAEAQ